MPSTRRFRLFAALVSTAALTAALVACGSDSGPQETDHPVVVASTDVWASVANAVAGDDADVSALFDKPGGDPHEFEPTNADAARVLDANVIVMNGGHYDAYMERIAADADGHKVTALDEDDDSDHDHDHGDDADDSDHDHGDDDSDHDHGDDDSDHDHADETHDDHDHAATEHAFYTLPVVADTADDIADALAEVAPSHAAAYRANAKTFRAEIDRLRARMSALGTAHPNTRIAATEPLATTLLDEAGITDVAPPAFTSAVEEGQSPSAADRATFDDLLRSHKAAALLYNVQSVDPATEAVLATAKSANVPVVEFTESLPEGVDSYIAWQSAQIAGLEKALNA
ncbi:zinc ABC transporter substrate-binding protein [Gordonia sp. HY002]|uniref:metal ABC transporter solute-binding protein, Zn/Mn family n=1 Tax=Gordonia zhenghanii TaxID=2911516 RepID=UPI001EF123E1|nr:zinc ABC transporter substrate-binding protein [Gordonia zhenghanii]MCF8570022.1 zinc ABC transporter substrate-binding protein [Gordonia zhenghanii]MCF8607091.1 zinc ABC transporter substrate-binding protein [Gordonia zhenghanii]